MRIGFFTDTYTPTLNGVVISIDTFKAVFEEMGHKVYIYAPSDPHYKDKSSNIFRFESIRIREKPEMRLALPWLSWNTYQKARTTKLDIVHVHTPFTMGRLGRTIAKYQCIPLVTTHHTRYPEQAVLYFKEKNIVPKVAKSIAGWINAQSDTIIAPSLKVKKRLRNYYKLNKSIPIKVVLTGTDLDKFKPSQENRLKIRKELGINPKKKVLLSVSIVTAVKNSEFLFKVGREILKKRKDTVLLVVGGGDLKDELEAKAKKLKLSKSIIYTGQVPYPDMPKYYQAADMFLFPSLTDTQGIVLLEAMATGLPVITLKDDAFAGVVKDNQNGYVVKRKSISLFSEKVNRLLDDQDLYDKFSLKAYQTAQKFSKENEAQKLLDIYKKLI